MIKTKQNKQGLLSGGFDFALISLLFYSYNQIFLSPRITATFVAR